jgi:TrmH family RNA methyltransferase
VTALIRVESRHNPTLALVRKLQADPAAYRRQRRVWLEGEHLVRAALAQRWALDVVLLDDTQALPGRWDEVVESAAKVLRVPPALWREACALESPPPIAALAALPPPQPLQARVRTVVLDRLQDAGNVGSILRSAAAFGFAQVVALTGCVALWSPKVLRAATGAHFALQLHEQARVDALDALSLPLLATSSHGGEDLASAALPDPCAWLFGHEGGGVAAALLARCDATLRIAQPGGQESLNVAAAAAVCLYESMRRRGDNERGG